MDDLILPDLNRTPAEARGKIIAGATLDRGADPEKLEITFADGSGLSLFDAGQSCCEKRYISTVDDLSALVGRRLVGIEAKAGPTTGDRDAYDVHESMFVEIATDGGFVTLVTHNDHNGYYGGFCLNIEVKDSPDAPGLNAARAA